MGLLAGVGFILLILLMAAQSFVWRRQFSLAALLAFVSGLAVGFSLIALDLRP